MFPLLSKHFVRRDARDPRARVRQARAEEEAKVFNGVVRALNALSCGFAGGGPKPGGLGANIALQEAVARQLESRVKDFAQGQPCRRGLLSNCGVCTSVVCMCGAYYSWDSLERGLFAAGLSGSLAAVDEAKAVPLVAERLSLPAGGAVVRLVDVLPGKLAVLLAGGRDMVRPREEWPPQPRPSLIVEGYGEWAAVVRRLSAAGMIVFLDRAERINGAFAVPKPDGGLRFIFNGTAANEVFFEPPRVDLPTPSHVAELEVPGGAAVLVAKTDLSDFFHSFRVEPWLLPFFAMPAVRAGDVGAVGCEADSMVFPCLATVPMELDELGAPDKVINRPRHGLYVDDFMQLVTEPALPRARRLRGLRGLWAGSRSPPR